MTDRPTIVDVASVSSTLSDEPWPFAVEQAAAIDTHWRKRRAANPDLFNGRVLLLSQGAVESNAAAEPVFRGTFLQTDFKAFMAWREFGFPAAGVRNCFSMAALESGDGAFVLGEMAPHTAPAGQIYFPSGTPDLKDVRGIDVDIEGSAERELGEETGLDGETVVFVPGVTLVMDAVRVCCMKRVLSSEPAEALVAGIHAWLARDAKPEFCRMHVVRENSDIVPAVPDFVAAYIRHRLAER